MQAYKFLHRAVDAAGHQGADFQLTYGTDVLGELAASNVIAICLFVIVDNLTLDRKTIIKFLFHAGMRTFLKPLQLIIVDIGVSSSSADNSVHPFFPNFFLQILDNRNDNTRLTFHRIEN